MVFQYKSQENIFPIIIIIIHKDTLGVVAHITKTLSEHYVNIVFMRLFREAKVAKAYTIVAFDGEIVEKAINRIYKNTNVEGIIVIGENENGF